MKKIMGVLTAAALAFAGCSKSPIERVESMKDELCAIHEMDSVKWDHQMERFRSSSKEEQEEIADHLEYQCLLKRKNSRMGSDPIRDAADKALDGKSPSERKEALKKLKDQSSGGLVMKKEVDRSDAAATAEAYWTAFAAGDRETVAQIAARMSEKMERELKEAPSYGLKFDHLERFEVQDQLGKAAGRVVWSNGGHKRFYMVNKGGRYSQQKWFVED